MSAETTRIYSDGALRRRRDRGQRVVRGHVTERLVGAARRVPERHQADTREQDDDAHPVQTMASPVGRFAMSDSCGQLLV
jgi:hypothetical protein